MTFTLADGSTVEGVLRADGTTEALLGGDGRVSYTETHGAGSFQPTLTRTVNGAQPGDHLRFDIRGQGLPDNSIRDVPAGCRCLATSNVAWDGTTGAVTWDQVDGGKPELRYVRVAGPINPYVQTMEVADGGNAMPLVVWPLGPNLPGTLSVVLIECVGLTYDHLREDAARTQWGCR